MGRGYQPWPHPRPCPRPRVGRGQVRQTDSNTGSEGAPRSEGRSRVLRGRGRRTTLALGGGARDREGIVLLVGGRPGPLRLWLILPILLLHQRDGGGVEKSKRGRGWRPSGQARPRDPYPSRRNSACPSPWAEEKPGSWGHLGCSGQGCLAPSAGPHLSSLPAPTSGVWVLEKGGLKVPGLTLSCQEPPTPAGDAQSPTQP